MPKRSAGLLMYRRAGPNVAVLLVHPGGPFWAKKDLGAWSIPKGEYADGEDPLAVARRRAHTGPHGSTRVIADHCLSAMTRAGRPRFSHAGREWRRPLTSP